VVKPLNPYDGPIFSCVVIDGSNVIHSSSDDSNEMSLHRVIATQVEVEKLGWPTLLAMKFGTYKSALNDGSSPKFPIPSTLTPKEKDILAEMKDMGKLSLIHAPSKHGPDKKDAGVDDEFLLKTALEKDGWILSNDRYRDHIRELTNRGHSELAEQIKERWIELAFVGNDSTPIFNLPQNMASQLDTEIIESQEQLEEMVFEYDHAQATIQLNGELLDGLVNLPLRQPIGRMFFIEYVPKGARKHLNPLSRSHFRLDSKGSDLWVTDLESTNGTLLNGTKIPPRYAQKIPSANSIIRIGKIELLLE